MTKHKMKKSMVDSKSRKTITRSDKKMMKRGAPFKKAAGGGSGMQSVGVGSSNNNSGRAKAMAQARMMARLKKRR